MVVQRVILNLQQIEIAGTRHRVRKPRIVSMVMMMGSRATAPRVVVRQVSTVRIGIGRQRRLCLAHRPDLDPAHLTTSIGLLVLTAIRHHQLQIVSKQRRRRSAGTGTVRNRPLHLNQINRRPFAAQYPLTGATHLPLVRMVVVLDEELSGRARLHLNRVAGVVHLLGGRV